MSRGSMVVGIVGVEVGYEISGELCVAGEERGGLCAASGT